MRFCYWTVADGNHGKMAATTVASARKVGVTADFHIWTDIDEIPGAIVHPCGKFDKTLYMFKFHFLKNEVAKLDYDYFVFFDADTYFVKDPGDLTKFMAPSDKVFVQMENDCTPSRSKRKDWWSCPINEYGPFLKEQGANSDIYYNTNAGFWIVRKDAIDEFYERTTKFFDAAHKRGYNGFTEEPALAFVGHIMQDPTKRTFEDTSWLWASDWTGQWKDRLPEYKEWQFEDYMSGEKKMVKPFIVHCMRSKDALIKEYENRNTNWVVTSCDSNGFNGMLIPFIASLKGVAKWNGNIAIVDLGLTDSQKKSLLACGIKVFPKSNKSKAIVSDRFFSLYDNMNSTSIYAHFDADIWFTSSIDDLFKCYDGKLKCTIDCNNQGFITGVIPNIEVRSEYKTILEENIFKKYKKPLQVGFVCGNKTSFTPLISTLGELINGVAADAYGTDTLAINMACFKYEDKFDIIGIEYNCLPDWNPNISNKVFTHNGNIIKAIHQTSPYRKLDKWAFNTYYPNILLEWRNKLTSEDSVFQKVKVKNVDYFIRPGTWDHTILFHSDEYSVSKNINFPNDACIVDIGGHIGGFTKLVATQYPNIPIYTFEPDPDNFKLLQMNVDGMSNVKIFNCGVGAIDSNGKVEIPSIGNTGMNRIQIGDGNIKIISPKTLLSIVKEKNIVLLKIDCEGGEWGFFDVLSNMEEKNRIWEIQSELHTDLYGNYEPFKEYPSYNESVLRELMKEKLKGFSVFIELCRTMKAYNKEMFL